MSRGPLPFKQRDLTRAVKGVKAAGIEIACVKVDTQGSIYVLTGNAGEPSNGANSWDQAIDELESRR